PAGRRDERACNACQHTDGAAGQRREGGDSVRRAERLFAAERGRGAHSRAALVRQRTAQSEKTTPGDEHAQDDGQQRSDEHVSTVSAVARGTSSAPDAGCPVSAHRRSTTTRTVALRAPYRLGVMNAGSLLLDIPR